MPTVVQDVSGDSALQTAIAALKAKIEGAEESSDIAQAVSQINTALAGKQNTLTFDSAPSSGSSNPVTSGGVKTALDGKQDTLIFDAEPTAESTKPVTSGGVKEALDDIYSEISDRITAAEEDIDIRGGAIYESASGSLVEIADGGDNLPMKSAVVTMEPIQDLHGYDSPWPAGGGKNLIDDSKRFLGSTGNSLLIGTEQGDYPLYLDSGTYTLSAVFQTGIHDGAYVKETNSSPIAIWSAESNTTSATFEINTAGYYRVYLYNENGVSENDYVSVMLETGSTASDYAPYSNICPISGRTGLSVERCGKNLLPPIVPSNVINGTWSATSTTIASATNARIFAIPIPKNTDIYIQKNDSESGGLALCDTGSITVGTLIYNITPFSGSSGVSLNSGSHTWLCVTTSSQERLERWWTDRELMISVGTARQEYVAPSGYSEISVNWETEAGTVYGGSLDVVSGKLIVDRAYIASYNGETLPSTWISDRDVYAAGTTPTTGAQVVYKLTESVEYQLSENEIRTLLGENNMWSDAGDMAVEYPADTKMYIDNKIAEAIAAALA